MVVGSETLPYPAGMHCRWVLLDVGDTLLRPRESFGAVYARTLAGLGEPRDGASLERALRAAWTEVASAIPVGTDRYGFYPGGEEGYWLRVVQRTLALAGGCAPGLAEQALPALRSAFAEPDVWAVFADVPRALDRLAGAGIKLGIVSNWDSRLPTLLERLGLASRFGAMAVSSLDGVEKPDPALFHRAMERLGADARFTVHVGDVPELDVEGARAAGVSPLLLDRLGRFGGDALPDLGAVADLLLA